MPHPKLDSVVAYAKQHVDNALERLCGYLTIPAISCDSAHHADIDRLAGGIASDLGALGFEVRVLRLDGALPVVAAERAAGRAGHPPQAVPARQAGHPPQAVPARLAGAPTVLIYGHLDLQPVKGEVWQSPPHRPERRDGRLYARGSADDMGGWVSHLAALEAWLAAAGEVPLNVRLLIESEEEIGSPNLERYMDAYPDAFAADAMVLTDCENPSTELPGLTVSLRGIYEVEVLCEALTADVHSGLWGNMAPDPGNALVKLLARLIDDDGRFLLGRAEVDSSWRERAWQVPLGDDVVRLGARVRPDVPVLPHRDRPPAEWLWRQPAVTILSTTFPRPTEHKNAVRKSASATLSIRLAPGQRREQMRALLEQTLFCDVPAGVHVSLVDRPGGAESWLYEPKGPAFEAADRAYKKAWGKPLLHVGVGGSIPFVALFGRRFGDLPLILNGVMDPETGAHGPNESLDLGIFEKAILANVYLLDELAAVL